MRALCKTGGHNHPIPNPTSEQGRVMGQRLIQFAVDKYGLEYYWWYWPALGVITIASAVLWVVLLRYRERVRREHPELFPEPPHRDSWL